MASLVQRYYSAAIVTPPTPADYFTDAVNLNVFKEQRDLGRVAVGDPPVVVSSITYGRIFIMTVTASTTEDKLSGALSASFSAASGGATVDVTAEQQKILKEAKVEVISNGGEEADFLAAVRSQTVNAFLERPHRITAARPISFQVDNLANGSAASFSETSNYALTTCAARAAKQVVVGSIFKLSGLDFYAARCNQNVYGKLFVNTATVVDIPYADPFLKVREASWVSPDRKWPPFSPPNPSRYKLDSNLFPPDGLYLAVFNRAGYEGPTDGTFSISGGLNNAIFPTRDDTANSYNVTVSPHSLGTQTMGGDSAKCPLHVQYTVSKVADLVTTES